MRVQVVLRGFLVNYPPTLWQFTQMEDIKKSNLRNHHE